jgi:hypothetical protein
MTIQVRSIGLIAVLCAGVITVNLQGTAEAADDNKACELVTVSEIESVLGANVTLKGSDAMPGGKTQICMGQASSARVMLRLVRGLDPHRDRSGSKEKAGMEMMKQMGAQVELKSFGPIVCSTLEPPTDKQQIGYNTTCTVNKDTAMAGIEITANKKNDMLSIERVHVLADKMAGRF